MKVVKLEPTWKKSVIEYQVWGKEVDGVKLRATMETGWRYGAFDISIPETEEEALKWANDRVGQSDYYTTIEEVYNDYGCEDWDDLKMSFCPSVDDEFIEIDDYDYEMLETWDGCWEEWSVSISNDEDGVFDEDEVREEIEDGWGEDAWEWMQENGWEEKDCYFEMHCNPKLTEYDENGNLVGEDMEVDVEV